MMKTNQIAFALLALFLIANVGCKSIFSPEDRNGRSWYFNSFESTKDIAGWHGNSGLTIEQDAPQNGGKQSAYVSGGCDAPHAFFTFEPVRKDRYFVLRCAGKNLAIGGSVSLSAESDRQNFIFISVRDSAWTVYESPDTLHVPAGQKMTLQMNAGGIVASAMLVDLIEIELVQVHN